MRRNVFGTTPESTSPTIVSLNDQKISATHSLADLNLCATIQKKSKVYCVLFFKLTCRIIYARLYNMIGKSFASIRTACFMLFLPAMAFGQMDFSGNWSPLYHEDYPERIPGPELGDYMGI